MSAPIVLEGEVIGYVINKQSGEFAAMVSTTKMKVTLTVANPEISSYIVDVNVPGLISTKFITISVDGENGPFEGLSNGIQFKILKIDDSYLFTSSGDLDSVRQVNVSSKLSIPTPPTEKSVKNKLKDEVKNFLKSKK